MTTEIVKVETRTVAVGNPFSQAMLADWLAFNADKSASTVKTYSKALENFFKWLAVNHVDNPRREDVIEYRNNLCATKKVSTARLYLTAVKIFARWIASRALYPNFADGVKAPALVEEGETHAPLTLDEAKKVLSSFKGNSIKNLRDKLIMRLMLNCGLRSIEIIRLDANDIEKRHGKIFLKVWGKGRAGKTARVEISKSVYNMILDYLNARHSARRAGEPLFVSTSNRNREQRLQTQSVSRLAKKTFRAVGIDSSSVTCHSCRHTAATLMLLNGVDIAKVQRILRHRNPATTEIYRHDITAATNDGVQILSDLLD
ncbi:MAG: tyrosine-type recombinase/integrase [Selenomonadaceae bacterium]|nr:tyrosine-type recombinase/integrase [Selenomonadaceae bacterium]MBQ7493712.1 tyrosine-type recombinase/integrase [Selenomonadaceae bacterium]